MLRFFVFLFFLLISAAATADLDRALEAYNAEDFERAAAEAAKAGNAALSSEDRLLAEEIHLSSRYFTGEAGPKLRNEVQALDAAIADHSGQDALERLGVLFILSDLHYQLGEVRAALRADAVTARIALKHSADAVDDLLWALRNLAIAHDDDAADPRDAVYFAALFEFFSMEFLGSDAPLTQEAVAMSALALLRTGEDTRAAQKFLLYDFEDWETLASLGPDEDAIVSRLFEGLDTLPVDDHHAWMHDVRGVHEAYLEREKLADEISELVAQGQLDFTSPFYLEALQKMERYASVAHPEDPVTAFFLNMILKSHLDIGDFGGARPYLSTLLAYPPEYIVIMDLPLGQLAGAFALRGGVEDALFKPLLQLALDLEQIVPGDDPDLPVDLTFSLGQIAERQGRMSEAYALYTDAVALGAAPGVRPKARHRALHSAASTAADLNLYDEAEDLGLHLLAGADRTGDNGAISAAYTVLSRVAMELGDADSAKHFAEEKLSFEKSLNAVDPSAVRMAEIALAIATLNADGVGPDLLPLLASVLSGPTLTPEEDELRFGLMLSVAKRMAVTPESFPTSEFFASVSTAQLADLVTVLAEAAYEAQDLATTIDWISLGHTFAVDGSAAWRALKELEGRIALDLDEPSQALAALRVITERRTATKTQFESGALAHIPYHIAAAARMAMEADGPAETLYVNEVFRMTQLNGTLRAGQALNSALFRQQAGGTLQGLLRERQRLEVEMTRLGEAIAQAQFDGRSAEDLATRLSSVLRQHEELTRKIGEEAPEWAEVTGFRPLDLADVQAVLGPEDVLLVYASSDLKLADNTSLSHLVALTRDEARVVSLPARAELKALADQLRCSAALTDPNCTYSGQTGTRGMFAIGATPQSSGPEFDTALAHEAYLAFLSPVSDMLSGRSYLLVVPDQALATLPFHLMLKEPLPAGRPLTEALWMIRDHAIEIAPTVASLVALREDVEEDRSGIAFLGVGDPLIGLQRAGPLKYTCQEAAGAFTVATLPNSDLQRASGAARRNLISDMSALPDTRCELRGIAARFAESQLLLHGEASESRLKEMSEAGELRGFSVLNFATHGLIAGELGVNEAGLVLTPPDVATAHDDGLLTTAEIANLDLDAEFVILSACNTASGDSRHQEGLSGLASAFLVAGAKSLMVSHWPVYSDAAVTLTTRLFDEMTRSPGISRSEAMRASVLSILNDPNATSRMQHPSFWAPFMIVGTG